MYSYFCMLIPNLKSNLSHWLTTVKYSTCKIANISNSFPNMIVMINKSCELMIYSVFVFH